MSFPFWAFLPAKLFNPQFTLSVCMYSHSPSNKAVWRSKGQFLHQGSQWAWPSLRAIPKSPGEGFLSPRPSVLSAFTQNQTRFYPSLGLSFPSLPACHIDTLRGPPIPNTQQFADGTQYVGDWETQHPSPSSPFLMWGNMDWAPYYKVFCLTRAAWLQC